MTKKMKTPEPGTIKDPAEWTTGDEPMTGAQDSYLHTQFLRIKPRRGAKKAILAVAASMLTAAYFMLRDGVEYRDLGPDHLDRRDRSKAIPRLVRRLRDLEFENRIQLCHCAETPEPMMSEKKAATSTRTRPAYGAT